MRTRVQTELNRAVLDKSASRSSAVISHARLAGPADPEHYTGNRVSSAVLQRQLGNRGATAYLARQENGAHSQPCRSSTSKTVIQPRMTVNAPNDPYEREAEEVAARIMRMPDPRSDVDACACETAAPSHIQRRCAKCEEEEKLHQIAPSLNRAPLNISRLATPEAGAQTAPPSVENYIRNSAGGGQPLPQSVRNFMEHRFGQDFSRIRVHTNVTADESARAIGALAYTTGDDLVFASGEYSPNSDHGRHLLAHELVHNIQQKSAVTGIAPFVLRQKDSSGTEDERANDPSFLLCLALCYLGIPPSLWRTVLNEMLSAASQEFRDTFGDMRGSEEFASWRNELVAMNVFNKFKAIMGFLGESRIAGITIKHSAAQAIRQALLKGVGSIIGESALKIASQVIRKVAIAIEIAIAAGCLAYCGGVALGNMVVDFVNAVADGIASFVGIVTQIGRSLGKAITRPILIAKAKVDPVNWDLSAIPTRSRVHLNLIGLSFRFAQTTNDVIETLARPLNTYKSTKNTIEELCEDINSVLKARGGFSQLLSFTPGVIGALGPLHLIELLENYRLITFVRDPEKLADQILAEPIATGNAQ